MSKINIPTTITDNAARVFRPEDYGAVGNGTTNDFPAFLIAFTNAVTVAQVGGVGIVQCDPRHTYFFNSSGTFSDGGGLSLPANLSGQVILDGGSDSKVPGTGATILFSSNNYRFVDMRYVETYDIFGNITIKNFNFNHNSVVVGTSNHIVLGHIINGNQGTAQLGSGSDSNHMNFTNIAVLNCKGSNVSSSSTTLRWLWFNSIQDGANEGTQTTLTAVFINNCNFTGGNYGAYVGGAYSSSFPAGTIGLNVYWDNIVIEDFTWAANALPSGSVTTGVGILLGNRGYGGSAKLVRCNVKWANDTGIETDGMQSCSIYDCSAIDCWNAGYSANNYNGSAVGNYNNPDDQIYRYYNCRYERGSLTRGRGFSTGLGGDGTQSSSTGSQLGTIVYDKCKNMSNGVVLGSQMGGFTPMQTPKAFKVINCIDDYRGWAQSTSGTNAYQSILITPGNNAATARCDIDVRGFRAVVNGTASAGTPSQTVLQVNSSSVVTLKIDGIIVEQSIVATNSYTLPSGMYNVINLNGGTVQGGSIRGVVIAKTTSDDSAPNAIIVNSSTSVTLARAVYISECDFTQMLGASPTEISIGNSTNKALVFQRSNQYVNLKEPSSLSVGSSPYTYQNLDGYDETVFVSGAAATSITKSTDGGSTFTSTGLTSGPFFVQHTDSLKVTYSSTAPTMVKFPHAR